MANKMCATSMTSQTLRFMFIPFRLGKKGRKITQSQVFTAWGISQSWNVIGTTTECIAASPLSVKSIYEQRAFHKRYIEDWRVHVQISLSDFFFSIRFISCTTLFFLIFVIRLKKQLLRQNQQKGPVIICQKVVI